MENHSGIIELDTLRRSRDFLQSVIDNIGDPTMVTDVNYHILLANKAIKKIFDGRRDPVAEHLCCFEVIHHLDRPCPVACPGAYPCPVNEVISTLMPSRVIRTHHDSLDNEIFMEIIASPVFDDAGEIVRIVESFHNITRYKEEGGRLEGLVFDLQNALAKAKRLAGLLPICMICKRIRSEKGDWENIEVYIRNHSEAEFTHGLCLECESKLYGLQEE
ncbi:MAG: PAS domain-containing protein [Nitrospirota bacterium]